MIKKIVKNFSYDGLGFPVELHDVEMVMVNGDFCPKIDVRAIAKDAAERLMRLLVLDKRKLTDNELKFLRTYFNEDKSIQM